VRQDKLSRLALHAASCVLGTITCNTLHEISQVAETLVANTHKNIRESVEGPKTPKSEGEASTTPSTPRAKPSIDRVGSYRITDEIGAGGMAVVYKGYQESLGRHVAIKALKTSLTSDPSIVTRFEREAMSVASFQHENIITIYDFFKERGALFMVMEFVEGIDLYDLLERCEKLPIDVALITALQVARALDYAHFRGVIHRDVKPANIILSRYGEVKLTDFGIARTEHSDLTEAGVGLGTPAYMSPEQIVGERLDHRSDIWSAGIVLYQLITGQKPFIDDAEKTALQRIRLEEHIPVRDLVPQCPIRLEQIIGRCLQKDREERYESTQQLVVDLEQHLAETVFINYRARLVVFLKDQKVIGDEETTAMLHPALIGSYDTQVSSVRAPRRPKRKGSAGRKLALAAGLLLALGGAAAGGYFGRSAATQIPSAKGGDTPCAETPAKSAPKRGKLLVVVYPWAHVKVDGRKVATTPFAKPLSLTAGKHKVTLYSDYMSPIEREITIKAGQLTMLRERAELKSSDRRKR
jgi:serine/threonine protein kinase